jgi:hypothetical protein
MYFIIFKPEKEFQLFSNELFGSEKEAVEYGKRNKFKKIEWKVVEYNSVNFKKYWRYNK